MDTRTSLTNPAKRLPAMMLESSSGTEVSLEIPRRRSGVVVLIHGGACAICRAYVLGLLARAAEIAEWDGQLLVVQDGESADLQLGEDAAEGARVYIDRERILQLRIGLAAPAVLVADQWREIHLMESAGAEHGFVAIDEILAWLRYLAVQCPECQGEAF